MKLILRCWRETLKLRKVCGIGERTRYALAQDSAFESSNRVQRHELFKMPRDSNLQHDAEGVDVVSKKTQKPLSVEFELHHSLQPIVEQLCNHLDSMQANTTQADGIAGEISKTAAELDRILYRRLLATKYPDLSAF